MARVTIEDCISRISSRFKLVVLAAQRAREIVTGSRLTVERNNDKDAVVALREIAAGKIDINMLEESVIKKYLSHQVVEEEDLAETHDSFEIQEDMAKLTVPSINMEEMSFEDEEVD